MSYGQTGRVQLVSYGQTSWVHRQNGELQSDWCGTIRMVKYGQTGELCNGPSCESNGQDEMG